MYLFSCVSPSLELDFCYSSLNLGCVFPQEKAQSLILEDFCILPVSQGEYSIPCVGISYILFKVLPPSSTSSFVGYLVRNVELTLVLGLGQIPSHNYTASLWDGPTTKAVLGIPTLCIELIWSLKCLLGLAPFPELPIDF
jgi:hypothetical protein